MARSSIFLITLFGSSMVMATASFAQAANEYVMKAGASDLYEKQSSQLVLKSTKNANVRQFAQMMVSDHSQSTAKVKAAAVKSGVKPQPPMLDAEQKAMITRLGAAEGAARDAMYLSQQRTAHSQALALHQGYAKSGNQPALKGAAAEIVPVVQHHVAMLDKMKM